MFIEARIHHSLPISSVFEGERERKKCKGIGEKEIRGEKQGRVKGKTGMGGWGDRQEKEDFLSKNSPKNVAIKSIC